MCRVLMIVENQYFETDRRVYQEACTLMEDGEDLYIISPKQPDKPWVYQDRSMRVYQFPEINNTGGLLGYLIEYGYSLLVIFMISLWIWAKFNFDVVHIANPPDVLFLIGLFYKCFGKKYIFDHHDLSPELYLAKNSLKPRKRIFQLLLFLEKLSCRSADLIFVPNQSYQLMDIERHRIKDEKIFIVRNAPDLSKVIPIINKNRTVPNRGETTVVCFVGMMAIQDGLDYLIQAFAYIREKYPQLNFCSWLIGRGSYKADIEKMVEDLRLEGYVKLLGFMKYDKMLSLLQEADIGVEPSPVNSYTIHCTMIKVMDYMVVGIPVVAFDNPETRVTAGESALYAIPNNVNDFAERIVELIQNPDLRKKLGRIGQQRIYNGLSWAEQASRLLKGYQVLGCKGKVLK